MTNRKLKAFTLVELLAVIAVIGILAAILIPAIGRIRASAQTTTCASNLRQLGVAAKLFSNDNGGRLLSPPFATYWFMEIYPYLKSDDTVRTTAVFQCPSDSEKVEAFKNNAPGAWNSISYLYLKEDIAFTRFNQILSPASSPLFIDAVSVDTNDYRSNEKFKTKVRGSSTQWRHGSGVNLVYWDGHVEFIEDPEFDEIFNINH